MKTTGMVRKVDELGRLVLPIEMRRVLDISERDPVEIYVDGESIILRKHRDSCVFCGSGEPLLSFRDKRICADCAKAVSHLI